MTAVPVLILGLLLAAGCDPMGGAATATPTAVLQPTLEVPTPQPTDTAEAQAPTEEATEAATNTPEPAAATPTEEPTQAATEVTQPPDVSNLEWKQAGLAGKNIQSLALLTGGNNLVLAAGPDGQWRASYDYTQWEELSGPKGGRSGTVASGSADVIYATSHTGCASGAEIVASRSTDGGNTWQQINVPSPPIEIAAANGGVAYGATCTGVIKTTDSGVTWSDLPGARIENFDPHTIASTPDGQTVYLASYSEGGTARIKRSTDAGATWTEITPQGEEIRASVLLYVVPGSVGRPDDAGVYMASSPGLLWFLTDGGTAADWKLFKGSDPRLDVQGPAFEISALYVDTAFTETKPEPVIYVARTQQAEGTLKGLGVYRSTNAAMTWEPVGNGLGEHVVNSLLLAPQNALVGAQILETLIVGTDDGVWTATIK
jgi:photosystem II stability/assembly factor-like uncharacterized protein